MLSSLPISLDLIEAAEFADWRARTVLILGILLNVMSIHLWSVLGRLTLVLYTALIKGKKGWRWKGGFAEQCAVRGVRPQQMAEACKGQCWVVALRERWREWREMRRRNGVRLALADEEAEGMLQFDSSNSVCSYVVLYAHSARHPDNTNNKHQPKQLLGALLLPCSSDSIFFSQNAQQPLPVLNPGPHPLI